MNGIEGQGKNTNLDVLQKNVIGQKTKLFWPLDIFLEKCDCDFKMRETMPQG